MNYQHYKIEIILASSLLFMVMAYGYKSFSYATLKNSQEEIRITKAQIGEIIALKELWGDKKIGKKVKELQSLLSASKVSQFSIKSKKLTASFKEMGIDDLNRLTNKLTSLAVAIEKFHLSKETNGYRLEIKCKW
jgi:uncharacterized membrane protein YqhA